MAFVGCESLIKIDIPDSVTYIGSRSFEKCQSLQEVKIPGSVEQIGTYKINDSDPAQKLFGSDVFVDCISLQKIIIPENSTEKFKHLLPKKYWDKLCCFKNEVEP